MARAGRSVITTPEDAPTRRDPAGEVADGREPRFDLAELVPHLSDESADAARVMLDAWAGMPPEELKRLSAGL